MQKFSADGFFRIAKYLADVRARLQRMPPNDKIESGSLKEGGVGHQMLVGIKSLCNDIGLRVSTKALDHMLESDIEFPREAIQHITQIEQTIMWEMEDKLFMYIPPERAACYNQPNLLGETVNQKFPTLQYDTVEAGNCYVAGRGTAAVFHLMRIMETGVQQFGAKLGVSLAAEKNWQNILDEVNKAIKAKDQKAPETKELAAASANLYSVKLAWRNEVMHPKDTYTLEEADNLIRQVKIFMEQLAKVV